MLLREGMTAEEMLDAVAELDAMGDAWNLECSQVGDGVWEATATVGTEHLDTKRYRLVPSDEPTELYLPPEFGESLNIRFEITKQGPITIERWLGPMRIVDHCVANLEEAYAWVAEDAARFAIDHFTTRQIVRARFIHAITDRAEEFRHIIDGVSDSEENRRALLECLERT